MEAASSSCVTMPLLARSITSSVPRAAEPAVSIGGDADKVFGGVDALLSKDDVSPQEVADAAATLAYLQATGQRRLWGKVLENAALVKDSLDAASLSTLLWATSTANVSHYKTLVELSGPAKKLLNSFSPAQLAVVVEGLGRAGLQDLDFFNAVSSLVSNKVKEYSPTDLAKIAWGFAAADVEDVKLLKAIGQSFASAGDKAGAKDAVQLIWALAKLQRRDTVLLDVLLKALKAEKDHVPVDMAALLWSLGVLQYSDTGVITKAIAAVRGAADSLTTEQKIEVLWAISVLGTGEKEASSLVQPVVQAITAAPDAVSPHHAALLFEAVGSHKGALPDQVLRYTQGLYQLVRDHQTQRRTPEVVSFISSVAEAAAVATGARYKPEIEAKVKQMKKVTEDGILLEIAPTFDGKDLKVVLEPLSSSEVSSTSPPHPLGSAVARKNLLEARGYKVVHVLQADWSSVSSREAGAQQILKDIKATVPQAKAQVDALVKKLSEPFDPYA